MRVLIVDDVFSNRRFLSKLLQRRLPKGTVFEEAEEGQAAVAAVERRGAGFFSVISMDKEMPVMVGLFPVGRCSNFVVLVMGPTQALPSIDVLRFRATLHISSDHHHRLRAHGLSCCRMQDGYEATAAIRRLGYAGLLLGCTGNALEADQAAFIRAGANEVRCDAISRHDKHCVLIDILI